MVILAPQFLKQSLQSPLYLLQQFFVFGIMKRSSTHASFSLTGCRPFGDRLVTERLLHIHRVSKNTQNCFRQNFVKFPSTLIIFGIKMAQTIELCKLHYFPPHLICVNALPCKTQMFQIVTQRCVVDCAKL